MAWAKVRVEVRLSQVADNARDGTFWKTIATAEPACKPRQVTARGKAEGRAQPSVPPPLLEAQERGNSSSARAERARRQLPSGS